MSQKRNDDMAIIAAALANGATLTDKESGEPVTLSDIAPADTGFPGSPIKDAKDELAGKGSKVAEQKPTPEQEEAARLLQQQKHNSLVKQKLLETGRSAGQAINSVQNGLGDIPAPGGLAVPLIVLMVFLMVLIKINGHTRLTWLWLVLSRNAAVQNVSGGASMGTGLSGADEVTTLNPVQPPIVVPLTFYRQSYELDEW